MNFKLKLALAAAAATLLSAPAFAENFDATTAVTAAGVFELAVAELAAAPALSADINMALIAQEGTAGLIAYIDQTSVAGSNFAAIGQASATPDVASIVQVGDLNRASIYQRQ